MKAVNREFGPPGQGEGRSTRRLTGSLAALQRRKLPHVPGMRCPNPPGVCCVCVRICACVFRKPVKHLDPWSDPEKYTHTHFSARAHTHTLTHTHRQTHTHTHTHTLQVRLSWLLIHNTRPERRQRRRSVSPKSSAEVTAVERYWFRSYINCRSVARVEAMWGRKKAQWKTSAQYDNPTLRGASKRC